MMAILSEQVWQCSVRQMVAIDMARVQIASPGASRGIDTLPYGFT